MTDGEVIRNILEGEINQYEVLVKKYLPKVRMFVNQRVKNIDDGEDIIQETFIRTYKNLERFDQSKSLYPYLLSVATSQIAEFYRKNKKSLVLSEESVVVNDEEPIVIKLPYILQLIVAGYSYSEIAKKLNRPINTVKTLIRRAKLKLKKEYDQ